MQNRLYYFDVLKGIAIFMVVLGHIIEYCMVGCQQSVPFRLVSRIHMPLFFFISGWFSYKLLPQGCLGVPKLVARARQLLLPMVVVSSLAVLAAPGLAVTVGDSSTVGALWASPGKCGYWFNLVLFEIIAIYALLVPVFNRLTTLARRSFMALGVYVVLFLVQRYVVPEGIKDFLSLNAVSVYWVPFIFGVLARSEAQAFMRALTSASVMSVTTVVLALTMFCWGWRDDLAWLSDSSVNIVRPVAHVALACVAVAVVWPWCGAVRSPGEMGVACRLWTALGRNSLGIYLLHFFFLFPVGAVQNLLGISSGDIVPIVMLAAVAAGAVIALVMLVIAVIRPARRLSLLITGS